VAGTDLIEDRTERQCSQEDSRRLYRGEQGVLAGIKVISYQDDTALGHIV